jgi:hypothetical protein
MNSFFSSFLLSCLEINYYITSNCDDSYSRVSVYFNFFLTVCFKLALLNFVNLEVFHTMPLDFKIPFLVPILGFGLFPVMQMPQYVYDFLACVPRGRVFSMKTAYELCNVYSIFFLILIGIFAIIAAATTTCVIPNRVLKQFRNLAYIVIGLTLLATNLISIILSLSQVNYLVPSMFIENIIYWFLIATSIYCYFRKKIAKIDVFGYIGGAPNEAPPNTETKSLTSKSKSNQSSQVGSFEMGTLVVMK